MFERRPRLWHPDPLTVDRIVQVAILVLSPIAILLISGVGPLARWGFVVGLASQPFWIYATFRARQRGMFVISVVYLGIWIRGIVNHFELLG